jgi:twinkle protein
MNANDAAHVEMLNVERDGELPIVDASRLIQRGHQLYRSGGLPRGDSTGWPCVDEFYTVAPGQWTVITGVPGSGKSEWLDALLVNLAETEQWEFALYSPENFPTVTHLVKLVEKHERMPFGEGPTKRMTEQEYRYGAIWVCERFFWLEPTLKTPDELIEAGIRHRNAGKKFGIVLDPWNTLEHQRGPMNETDYVSFILSSVMKLARSAVAHIWLVVHPAKIPRNKDGTRPVPTPYDISGSAHWYNKPDNIITVHRDQADGGQMVDVHVQKVRFKHIGHAGLAMLRYDKVTGRYFDLPGIPGENYVDPERRV